MESFSIIAGMNVQRRTCPGLSNFTKGETRQCGTGGRASKDLSLSLFRERNVHISPMKEGRGREGENFKQAPRLVGSPILGLIPRPQDDDLSRNQESTLTD